jgi:hypothetical protein
MRRKEVLPIRIGGRGSRVYLGKGVKYKLGEEGE